MNEPHTVTAHNRLLYRGWNGEATARARPSRAHGAWLAAAPMLIVFAAVIAAGLLVGAVTKASAQAHAKDVQVAGAEQMDSGEMALDDMPYRPRNLREAEQHRVALVFQELTINPSLGIAENIYSDRLRRFANTTAWPSWSLR